MNRTPIYCKANFIKEGDRVFMNERDFIKVARIEPVENIGFRFFDALGASVWNRKDDEVLCGYQGRA